jgi:PAS domain S-box-containing protein
MGGRRDSRANPGGGGRRSRPLGQTTSADPFARLLAAPLRHLAAAFNADSCSIVTADWATGRLLVRAAYGLADETRKQAFSPRRLGEGVAGFVISHGQPLLLTDPGRDPRLRRISFTPRADVVSSLCIPLARQPAGTFAGTLNLTRKAGLPAFKPADLRLALSLVEWLRPCVEHASKLAAASARQRGALLGRLQEHLRAAMLVFSTVRRLNEAVTTAQVLECLKDSVRRVVGAAQQRYFLFRSRADSDAQAGEQGRPAPDSLRRLVKNVTRPAWMSGKRMERLARAAGLVSNGPLVLLPLRGSRPVGAGVISGLSVTGRTTSLQVRLLAALAEQAAAAIRHAASYERVVGRRFVALSGACASRVRGWRLGTPRGLGRSLLSAVREVMPFESAVLATRDGRNGRLTRQMASGKPWRLAGWEREAMEWALLHRRALITDGRANARPLAAIPLTVGRRPFGVLGVRGGDGGFSAHQARAAAILACQAAATFVTLQEARKAGRYAHDVVRSLVAGVISVDERGTVVVWSPSADETLRFPASEAVGRPFDEVLHEIGDRSGWQGVSILSHLAAEAVRGRRRSRHHEIALGESPARAVHLSVGCSPVRGLSGERTGAVLVIEDVTERKQEEMRTQQVRQLAALGQMAANVAHEVRNPLSAIKTAAQLLADEAARGSALHELAVIINEECDRLGKLTSDFLAYARPQAPKIAAVDIARLARRRLRLMSPVLAEQGIQAAARFPRDLPPAAADPELVSQVLLNLMTNAAQAMDDGGRMLICGRVRANGKNGRRRQLEISVSDTGPGIPPEHLGQIFDPFFTTKVRGTGLGLAIARLIVEAHSGHIEAQSQQGKGATFTVVLPAYRVSSFSTGGDRHGATR